MVIINQVVVDILHVVERQLQPRGLDGTQTTTPIPLAIATAATPAAASPTMSNTSSSSGGSGPGSSPLLFFVALGFGVVFTNLWIIVGVKYCFRYNARNRAIRNGEDVDPINLEAMPATRPHRRRREKKLMTMDEVNERFPLTKYKTWVASRAREGLPTAGGVTAPPSRAGSVRDVDGVIPSSPTGTKHSISSRPGTALSGDGNDLTITPLAKPEDRNSNDLKDSATIVEIEKGIASPDGEERNRLEEVQTTTSTVNKHDSTHSQDDDDDDDEQIHCAVPPELLTNPGDSCAICIDLLEEDDDIRGLTCGHAFHAGCLDPWLTSRRACCPLCKADYYTPKPRPEGEMPETERAGRRRETRMNMPQQPTSAWGIRGNTRLILPGRFGVGTTYSGESNTGLDTSRRARRERRRAIEAGHQLRPAAGQDSAGVQQNSEAAAPRRWVPRVSNPFSGMSMPTIRLPGRNQPTTNPSPSQLEAGVR